MSVGYIFMLMLCSPTHHGAHATGWGPALNVAALHFLADICAQSSCHSSMLGNGLTCLKRHLAGSRADICNALQARQRGGFFLPRIKQRMYYYYNAQQPSELHAADQVSLCIASSLALCRLSLLSLHAAPHRLRHLHPTTPMFISVTLLFRLLRFLQR